MKKLVLILLVVASACIDVTGVQEEIDAGLIDGIADNIICTQPLTVFGQGECIGRNANDTIIREAVMKWASSDPTVVRIDQDGDIVGMSIGTATITGIGLMGVPASVTIQVT